MINTVFRNKELKQLEKFSSHLWNVTPLGNGFPPTTDAMVKWCGILETIHDLSLDPKSIMDAGCGPSHLSLAIRDMKPQIQEIYCLDREQISPLLRNQNICKCFLGDFFEACQKNVPDDSLDLIVDGCSVTHFDASCNLSLNDGCYKFAKEAKRTLKKNGFYITCSDFSLSGNEKGEFVSVNSMIKSYEDGGLRLYAGSSDFNDEDAFIANKELNLGIVRLVFTV